MLHDYPRFDPQKHIYIVATAGGDGWEATYPIAAAIDNDQAVAGDIGTPPENWIDYLAVYDRADNEIAVWRDGAWRLVSGWPANYLSRQI